MADFRTIVNVAALAAFSDAGAEVVFGFEADSQLIINQSTIDVEISWDGQNVHKVLRPNEPDVATSWDHHKRTRVYVRRGAVPPGVANVEIIAATK
uniref:Uncharacterized protein n=1 Tax=viral metagenome TaxID=1070528 RepID=A0A6M3X7M8_9ZZZZ